MPMKSTLICKRKCPLQKDNTTDLDDYLAHAFHIAFIFAFYRVHIFLDIAMK